MAEQQQQQPSADVVSVGDKKWKVVTKTCFTCNKNLEGKDFRVCNKCEFVAFCDLECLKKGWKKHRAHCNPATADAIRRDADRMPSTVAEPQKPTEPATTTTATTAAATTTTTAASTATEPSEPLMPCGGNAKVVSNVADMSEKEKARLQAMAGTARAANMRTFTGCKGEKKVLGKDDVDPMATVVFQDCQGCDYTLDTLCTKVFVQGCTDFTFSVPASGKIVSATLEIYRSTNVTVTCSSPVLTVQTDASRGVSLKFADKSLFRMVVWAGCHDLTVDVTGAGAPVKTGMEEMQNEFKNLRPDIDQFKVSLVGEKIVNERVVRLDNGFPTTKREADEFDRRQEANLHKLAESMGITIKPKPREGPKAGRNDPCPCGSGKKFKNCCSP